MKTLDSLLNSIALKQPLTWYHLLFHCNMFFYMGLKLQNKENGKIWGGKNVRVRITKTNIRVGVWIKMWSPFTFRQISVYSTWEWYNMIILTNIHAFHGLKRYQTIWSQNRSLIMQWDEKLALRESSDDSMWTWCKAVVLTHIHILWSIQKHPDQYSQLHYLFICF